MGYRYAGETLNSGVMTDLTIYLLEGQFLSQRLILETTRQYHLEHGGRDLIRDGRQIAKVTLRNLKERGMIEPTDIRSNWKWVKPPEDKSAHDVTTHKPETIRAALPKQALVQSAKSQGADKNAVVTIGRAEGQGSGSVYVYWFPTYQREAIRNGETRWPVKVGMTVSGDVRARVLGQQGTAMPEYPVVGYICNTDYPSKIERIIHDMLYLWDRKIEGSPGNEWFLSNIDEVREIVSIALNRGLITTKKPRSISVSGKGGRSPDIPASGELIVTDRDNEILERAG